MIRTNNWRFLHGPGIDDPLVGTNAVGGSWAKYYYITDGRGRVFAFTDSVARNLINDVTYYQNGGNQAGAIHRSTTFANTRAEAPEAAGVSFYRNRYYDQTTGRWTQEDPIGIDGGGNLYGYAGNNPAAYTDPFGLCPTEAGGDGKTSKYSDCPAGSEGFRRYLSSMGRVDNAHARAARESLAPETDESDGAPGNDDSEKKPVPENCPNIFQRTLDFEGNRYEHVLWVNQSRVPSPRAAYKPLFTPVSVGGKFVWSNAGITVACSRDEWALRVIPYKVVRHNYDVIRIRGVTKPAPRP